MTSTSVLLLFKTNLFFIGLPLGIHFNHIFARLFSHISESGVLQMTRKFGKLKLKYWASIAMQFKAEHW
jgi:hypothetical protein